MQDAVHEVKAMAAKLRTRAEAVKSEICATAEECVKRIVSRKQEMVARVNGLITFLFWTKSSCNQSEEIRLRYTWSQVDGTFIFCIIENWIVRECNFRVFIDLAIMIYEP